MQDRIARLEEENARLATRQNLPNVVRIPEPEPEMQPAPAAQGAPPPPSTPEPPASQPGSQEESPTTRW
jgi:hypothetical protein